MQRLSISILIFAWNHVNSVKTRHGTTREGLYATFPLDSATSRPYLKAKNKYKWFPMQTQSFSILFLIFAWNCVNLVKTRHNITTEEWHAIFLLDSATSRPYLKAKNKYKWFPMQTQSFSILFLIFAWNSINLVKTRHDTTTEGWHATFLHDSAISRLYLKVKNKYKWIRV